MFFSRGTLRRPSLTQEIRQRTLGAAFVVCGDKVPVLLPHFVSFRFGSEGVWHHIPPSLYHISEEVGVKDGWRD